MAVTYDTFGSDFLEMVLRVVIVSTVVIPEPKEKNTKKCHYIKNIYYV